MPNERAPKKAKKAGAANPKSRKQALPDVTSEASAALSDIDKLSFEEFPGDQFLEPELDEREESLLRVLPELIRRLEFPEAWLDEKSPEQVWRLVIHKIELNMRSLQESSSRVQEAHAYREIFRHLCEVLDLSADDASAPTLIQAVKDAKDSESMTVEKVTAWIAGHPEAAVQLGFRSHHAERVTGLTVPTKPMPAPPAGAEDLKFSRPQAARASTPTPTPAQAPSTPVFNARYGTRVLPPPEVHASAGPINERYGTPVNHHKAKGKRAKGVFPPLSQNAGSVKHAQRAPTSSPNGGPRNPRYQHKLSRPGPPAPQPPPAKTTRKPTPIENQTEEPAVDEFLLNSPETIKAWCLENKILAGKLGKILVFNIASSPDVIQGLVNSDEDLCDNDDVQQILEWANDNRGSATALVMQLIPLLQ